MEDNTKIGSHCGSCRGGCRDCDEQTTSEAMLWRARYPDITVLGVYLGKRYTPKTLIDEVREFYDPNYLAFFGMCRALESYLTQFKDNLGLTIDQEAIRFLANGLVNLDCDVQ